jgi:hypothetical protein
MLAKLALAAAMILTLSHAPVRSKVRVAAFPQAGQLKLTNVRMTIGELGPKRPDAKLLPGDILFIGYDITGLAINDDGFVKYKMSMEVVDAAGKSIFKQEPRELEDRIQLRGDTIPARAYVTIGLDQDPGNYTCKVTVEDPKSKAKETLSVKFEVLKRDYGIVAVYATHDFNGQISAPTTGFVGQTLFFSVSVVDFQRDPKTKHPNVDLTMQILDEKGAPTLGKPIIETVDEKSITKVDEKDPAFAMRFPLFLSRPGKFTAKFTATDKVAKKSASYELPVTILPAN